MGANTVQTSINILQVALGFWVPTLGINNEPAMSAANMTQQVMLSPPFRWAWNRNKITFNTIASPLTQDYVQAVTDFGFIETATIQLPAAGKIFALNTKNVTPIGESSDPQQPTSLTVQLNNVGTNITLRFLGVPDKIYATTVWYQKFSPQLTDPTSLWTPPDYMSFVYNRGLLAHLYEARGDARAQSEKVAFAAALLSIAEGLTDTEKNIFLEQFLANPRMREALQVKTGQGVQARGQ